MENQKIKGTITKEVIDTLIELMKGVIGEVPVNIILRKINVTEDTKGKDIVYAFASATTDLLSKKASFAIVRQIGRELAQSMMNKTPKDQWEYVLTTALNDLGYAQEIIKEDDKAFICSCVFYDILQKDNLEPIEHSVCWTGLGFIEGFVREIKDVKGIKWSYRDPEENRCQFDYISK